MSDINEGDQGRKQKTREEESGKFYLLFFPPTITWPSNTPFRFKSYFQNVLSLSYSSTGNEEEKKGGERKRRNTETMVTEEEVTEVEERELLGGKRNRFIYAWLEFMNLSDSDVLALIQELDTQLSMSYLYLNSIPRRHLSKTMPYQLLNHPFILYLSLAGTMVTPYSLQMIPDDVELMEEEEQLVEEKIARRRRAKKKPLAELTPEGQAIRRAAQTAKRDRKKLRIKERKAAERELETAKSEQLCLSEDAVSSVSEQSGVFPENVEEAGPSQGSQASKGNIPKKEPAGVRPGAFKGKGKSKLKRKDNSLPSHQPSRIVVSVKARTATKYDLLAVTTALIEAKLTQQEPVGRAPPTQIRGATLEEGNVVIKVWDKASKNFAIKAINKGGQYKAVVQEGHLRMVFTMTALFASMPPQSLMLLLLRQNPGLPSGALMFVSRVRSSGGGWSIFVDVDRSGLGYLRGRGNTLSTFMEMVHLRPVEM